MQKVSERALKIQTEKWSFQFPLDGHPQRTSEESTTIILQQFASASSNRLQAANLSVREDEHLEMPFAFAPCMFAPTKQESLHTETPTDQSGNAMNFLPQNCYVYRMAVGQI